MNESTTSASEATVPGEARLGFIVCGALAREVHQIAHRRGWPVDIHGVPAEHHLYPDGNNDQPQDIGFFRASQNSKLEETTEQNGE